MQTSYTSNNPPTPLSFQKAIEKSGSLCLGIFLAIAAMPLLLILKLISQIVPQKQWEDFWDSFVEDSLR